MQTAERDRAGVIAPPPLIFLVPLLLGLALQRLRPLPRPPRWLSRSVGWPLVLLALATNLWAATTFRRARTPLDPRKPVARLVTWGPFRFSRNPNYVAFTALYLGLALVRRALWPLLFLPLALWAVRRGVIEREERYLARRFGDEYRRYQARVPRWLGRSGGQRNALSGR